MEEEQPKTTEFTGVQITKRVHRKLQIACTMLKKPIGSTTNDVMDAWADKAAKKGGFTFPSEDENG